MKRRSRNQSRLGRGGGASPQIPARVEILIQFKHGVPLERGGPVPSFVPPCLCEQLRRLRRGCVPLFEGFFGHSRMVGFPDFRCVIVGRESPASLGGLFLWSSSHRLFSTGEVSFCRYGATSLASQNHRKITRKFAFHEWDEKDGESNCCVE